MAVHTYWISKTKVGIEEKQNRGKGQRMAAIGVSLSPDRIESGQHSLG